MTDPTPTRAEVAISIAKMLERKANAVPVSEVDAQLFLAAAEAIRNDEALRERAEAAEAECARLKNIRSAIAEGYNAEAVALEKAVSETLTAQLTAARRAEAAAWNDAIEAAEAAYAHGFAAIRALRRAAPTEGEA